MSSQVYRNLLSYLRRKLLHIAHRNVETVSYSPRCLHTGSLSLQLNNFKASDTRDKSFFRKATNNVRDLEARGDPDDFGSLSKELELEEKMKAMPEEEDDVVRKDFYDGKVGKKRLSTKQYADLIKERLAQKKLVEAIDVLEVQMIKEDRVQPENYIYNLLIDGCAKVGYTQKAFKLYNDMKKRDLKVTGATYTSLFNACALSPLPGDGLKRANHLREIIIEKQVLLNRSNYHAMMKAFGRCGDLLTVFSLVDEMVSKGIPLKPETFCFLLQACLSDKVDGFRHAIMVWRKMREKGVKPTIYCYNLMLRSARDCGLGDTLQLTQDLNLLTDNSNQTEMKLLENKNNSNNEVSGLPELSDNINLPASLPNFLAEKPLLGSVVSIKRIEKPKHRLMLLGGSNGIIEQMKSDGVEADVKTATILLDLVPSNNQAELELMKKLRSCGVLLDINFCNMLIKRRCYRRDYASAKEVLGLISELRLIPDLMTFGVLSLSCRNTKDTMQFLRDLDQAGFRLNMEILGGLLCAARHSWNVNLIMYLMDRVAEEEIKVSSLFLKHLENFRDFTGKQIQLKSQGLPYHEAIDNPNFMESYDRFLVKFKLWSKAVDVDDREKLHPWKQYKKRNVGVPDDKVNQRKLLNNR